MGQRMALPVGDRRQQRGGRVLCRARGSSYARYSAFVPSVSGLIIQEKCEKYGHRENTQAEKYCQQMI